MTPKPNIEFDALGTRWWVESDNVHAKTKRIKAVLSGIDTTWSRFRDDSTVTRIAHAAGLYTLTRGDVELLQWYRFLYDITDGHVTPLIGQTLVDAGYDAHYSLRPQSVISVSPAWDDVLLLGDHDVFVKQPILIDVGAAGKGYAIDSVAKELSGAFCIDASGDMLVRGEPMRIGLQDPRDEKLLIGVATLTNASLCGSAINRRSWGDWHHIINPKTAQPVRDILATWVIAESAMHADGLATALFFTTPDVLLQSVNFQYCVLYQDGTVRYAGRDIELFTEGGES